MTELSEHASAPYRERLLWLVAIGFFMQSLDSTILNTALPSMAEALGESPLKMQSVIVAYALTTAMLIPATGWVADRFGTRRVYGAAIGLFVLGSVLCAVSPNLSFLVAARVVQGAGGAMMLPVGRLAVLRTLQVGDLVYIPGHVMMVIGHDNGITYTIHDTTGITYRGADGKTVRARLNSVAVTPLEPLLFNSEQSTVDRITAIQRIRPQGAP